MKFYYIFCLLFLILSSCATRKSGTSDKSDRAENYQELLNEAEARASNEGREILTLSRSMISSHEKISGSCWNYINTVYNRTGHPLKHRDVVFKGKLRGPYADFNLIQPGDWLYYVNHSYKGTEHSGIFVDWTNKDKKEALMISYAGEKRNTPARYKVYKLTNVYNIIRPK